MHTDKNRTYRLLSNRANLMAPWEVNDRIRRPKVMNIAYGFSKQDIIKHSDEASFLHSVNKIDYPSAHITKKVFNKNDLDSPLDREQAMLQGVVFENNNKATINQNFTPNKNLLNQASSKFINTQNIYNNKNKLTKYIHI